MKRLTNLQLIRGQARLQVMVRRAGNLLAWTDDELNELAAELQFEEGEDWDEDRKRGDW